MEYAVKAETKEGAVLVLRRGFASREDAEDHPVTMSLWKRVFVEEIESNSTFEELPPLPWDWVASAGPSNNGKYHAYLVDANGKKIAALWGSTRSKELMADLILRKVNPQQS